MDTKVLAKLRHFRLDILRLLITFILAFSVFAGLSGCKSQPGAPVVDATPGVLIADQRIPPKLQALIDEWNDPAIQTVAPFQIFDNLYYVGIDWVAAYVIETSKGLMLIDSLYGPWVEPMINSISSLGLDPNDIRYVLVTHGHFDHAGGAAEINRRYGATVVMTREDWALAREPATIAAFAMDVPASGQTAEDGDIIELGDTRIELFKTPGHTEGVLSMRYQVKDGANSYTAVTLGGVGLNFDGVERTTSYLASYDRLQYDIAKSASVSLPNHARMGRVFERAEALKNRAPGEAHPFVDPDAFQRDLASYIERAEEKLENEKNGTAKSALDQLTGN